MSSGSCMAPESRLYVSGYWPLPGNGKRGLSYYQALLPQTLALLRGQKLLFFAGDAQTLALVQQHCSTWQIALEGQVMPIMQLPQWDRAEALVASCERMGLDAWPQPRRSAGEKGVNHYWRDLHGSGADTYRQLLAVWLSKIALVAQRAATEPEQQSLAWVDSSVARFQRQRSNWRFWRLADRPGQLCHYASPMRYLGQGLPVNASYLSAPAPVWGTLAPLFDGLAQQASLMAYGHDEETILGECQRQHPGLFHCLGVPYTRLRGRAAWRWRLQDGFTGLLERR